MWISACELIPELLGCADVIATDRDRYWAAEQRAATGNGHQHDLSLRSSPGRDPDAALELPPP